MSEVYGAYALKGDIAKMADTLADTIHESDGKFIVMSVSLPYDVARFQKADAIIIAYLPRSMTVDPEDKVTEIQQYGPNMPVALYMIFSKDDAPTAKLPINIPQLDESYSFTETVLYERGFGLTYEAEDEPTTEAETTQPEETTESSTEATTEAATTAAETTAATISATTATTTSATTAASSTTTSSSTTSSSAVQTGESSVAIIMLVILIAAAGIIYYFNGYRKKIK